MFVCGWDGGGAAEVPVGKDMFAWTGNHPFARETNSCIFWEFFSLETFWKRELLWTDSHLKEQLMEGQDLGLKPNYWKFSPKFHKG